MHKLVLTLLTITVVGLGSALIRQRGHIRQLEAQLAMQKEEAVREVAVRQEEVAQLQERNEVFKRESEQLREKLADRTPVAPAAAGAAPEKKEAGGDFLKGFAKMFTDPEMKKVMRSQQGVAIRMMYGDMAKELGLASDEANLIFDLLAERQMTISAKAMTAGSGTADADTAAAEAQKTSEGYTAELKNILGDERMKKFEAYERTVGERMTLQQYQQSMTASGMPLDDTQRKSLLGVMTEERLRQPPSKFDPGSKDVASAMKAMRSGEGMEEAMQKQREFNQRVLGRARTILTADQTNAFEAAQKQMLEMQEMGIKMWKSGMGGGGK